MFDNEQFISSLFAFTLQPDVAVVITVYISTRHKSITLIFVAYGIRIAQRSAHAYVIGMFCGEKYVLQGHSRIGHAHAQKVSQLNSLLFQHNSQMLLVTYYSQNYAGIIYSSLASTQERTRNDSQI